jgi:hypothetical protein
MNRSNKMTNNIFDLGSNAVREEKEFSKKALNIDDLLNEDINLAYGARGKSPFNGASRADGAGSRGSMYGGASNFDN